MKTDMAKQSRSICRRFGGVLKAFAAAVAIAFAGAAQAAGNYEDVGGVRWYYEGIEGYCSVVKGENVAAVEPGSNTKLTVPKKLGGLDVKRIGQYAFYNLKGITSVTIPDGVEYIGKSAFYGCTGITSMTIPASVQIIDDLAFRGCENLSELTIWANAALTDIGKSAFEACTKLGWVRLPESIVNVAKDAFRRCTALKTAYLPVSLYTEFEVNDRKAEVFYNCSSSLKFIYEGTAKVDGLTWNYRLVGPNAVEIRGTEEGDKEGTLWIPAKLGTYDVVSIGEGAFQMYSCTDVSFPSSLTNIADYAFYMSHLESFFGGYNLVSIGAYAFSYTQLGGVGDGMEIDFPDTVKSIGLNACQYCLKLKEVSLPGGLYGKLDESQVFGGGPDNQRIKYRLGNDVFAQIVDGVGWSYKVEDFKATVTSGHYWDEAVSPNDLTAYTVPRWLGGYVVAKIGSGAFYGCKKLQSVTFTYPSNITAIRDHAFYDCTNLTTITLPTSLTEIGEWAFYHCKLASVTIPGGVEKIGDSAFSECSGLTSLTIANGVKEIGPTAFTECWGLTSVSIPSSVETIGNAAFYKCTKLANLTIAKGVKTIGGLAFGICDALTQVTVPDDVESLGDLAFMNCTSLQLASLPASLYGKVAADTFKGCPDTLRVVYRISDDKFAEKVGDYDWVYTADGDGVKVCYPVLGTPATNPKPTGKLVIPESIAGKPVTAIGYAAFQNCKDITEVVIPEGVTTIEQSAFSGCANLESVSLPDSLKIIYSYAFMNCEKLEHISLPAGLEQLWFAAFSGSALQQITIPGSVKEIKGSAFQDCTSLTEVVIQEGVETIGDQAFQGCTSLKSVTIPSTVTSIGENAFKGCPLEVVNVPAGEAETIAELLTASGFTVTPGLVKEADPGKWQITFEAQGGICSPKSMQVAKGSPLEDLPVMSRPKFGYEFVGWFTEAEGGEEISSATVPTADTTYYAQWSQSIFKVTFDANGGSPATTQKTLSENAKLGELPTPILLGSTLVGWFTERTGGTMVSSDTVVTADVTYYAHWKENEGPTPVTCTVTFNANGGSVTEATRTVVTGAYVGALPAATRAGYTLVGWFTAAEGGVGVTAATIVSADVTFYAQWKEKGTPPVVPLLTVVPEGGGSATGSGAYVANQVVQLKAKALGGWVFSGWFRDGELLSQEATYKYTMGAYDTTIVAKFVTVVEDATGVEAAIDIGGSSTSLKPEGVTELDKVIYSGVYLKWALNVNALSAVKVKVSGLPSGLKFASKNIMKKGSKTEVAIPANTIYGAPTKPGQFKTVKVTVTTAGKNKVNFTIPMQIHGLEQWAVGQFDGCGDYGPVSLTIAANGKISGKHLANGLTWKLSAPYFDKFDGRYVATVTGKSGKSTFTETLVISEPAKTIGEAAAAMSGDARIGDLTLYQTFWKFEVFKPISNLLKKQAYGYSGGNSLGQTWDILLTMGSKGSMKEAGVFNGAYKASGSATLIPLKMPDEVSPGVYMGPFDALVPVYFAPNAKKGFSGYFEVLHLQWDGNKFDEVP